MKRGEKRSTRRKTSYCREENQQTQPTYDTRSGNRTRATLVGGEYSHHCVCTRTHDGFASTIAPSFVIDHITICSTIDQDAFYPHSSDLKANFSFTPVFLSDHKRVIIPFIGTHSISRRSIHVVFLCSFRRPLVFHQITRREMSFSSTFIAVLASCRTIRVPSKVSRPIAIFSLHRTGLVLISAGSCFFVPPPQRIVFQCVHRFTHRFHMLLDSLVCTCDIL